MNYDINYNDQRFQDVEAQKQAAVTENNNVYNTMINSTDKLYQDQIDAANSYAEQQKELQQANTDFTIEQINQQKEQAQKDYTKEQSASYVDWQKQSNQYGSNAEQIAASGLTNTGYSESSQVSMFNTYQNRVATARESYNQAVLNYNNAIKDAQLQNNSVLAEIAYNALQKQLELSLQGFQYKNQLILDKQTQQREIDNTYYQRYQNVLSQINTENQLKESIRQYEATQAEQKRQYEASLAEQQRQYNETMAFNKAKQAQEQANWEKEYALSKAKVYSSGSSGSSSSGSKSSSSATVSKNTTSSVNKTSTTSSSSSSKTSAKYTQTLNAARTLYNSSRSKSGSAFVEDYLARAINSGTITSSEASKILKSIGIK